MVQETDAPNSPTPARPFSELVYAGGEAEALIRNRFPAVTIEDASDAVHTERFQVMLPASSEREFYVFAIKEGLALSCLGFQLMMCGSDTDKDRLADWVDEATGKKVPRPWAKKQTSLKGGTEE
jgi:hypothetical protein